MCLGVSTACMSVYHMLTEPEEGAGAPETGVTDGREPPRGCWELNSGPLEPVHLTAEPSSQAPDSQILMASKSI